MSPVSDPVKFSSDRLPVPKKEKKGYTLMDPRANASRNIFTG